MRHLAKVAGILLSALACLAPLAASVHCDGAHDHDAPSSEDCTCACCSLPTVPPAHENGLMPRVAEHVILPDTLSAGTLLMPEIFRPPIAA